MWLQLHPNHEASLHDNTFSGHVLDNDPGLQHLGGGEVTFTKALNGASVEQAVAQSQMT